MRSKRLEQREKVPETGSSPRDARGADVSTFQMPPITKVLGEV